MARRDSNPDPLNPRTTPPDMAGTSVPPNRPGVTGAAAGGTVPSGIAPAGPTVTPRPAAPGVSGPSTASTPSAGSSALGQQGREASERTQEKAHEAKEEVKGEARSLASEAKHETRKAASQARGQVQSMVEERKDQAADQVHEFAGSLREAAKRLEEGDSGATALGRYAHRAADEVDRLSGYLHDRDLKGFVRDAESFARRHPDLFLGGTFLAGLIVARFFKASSERREFDGYERDYPASAPGSWNEPRPSSLGSTSTSTNPAYGGPYGGPGERPPYGESRVGRAYPPAPPARPVGE